MSGDGAGSLKANWVLWVPEVPPTSYGAFRTGVSGRAPGAELLGDASQRPSVRSMVSCPRLAAMWGHAPGPRFWAALQLRRRPCVQAGTCGPPHPTKRNASTRVGSCLPVSEPGACHSRGAGPGFVRARRWLGRGWSGVRAAPGEAAGEGAPLPTPGQEMGESPQGVPRLAFPPGTHPADQCLSAQPPAALA